jgi:16S rRNA (adenine1518-N6/adenine1519-N6)-dimethyltransferase
MLPKKSLGQNFLMHPQIAERIVLAANVGTGKGTILEIGPGTGMLTKALLEKARKVIAIEADGELIAGLTERFGPEIAEGRLEIIHQDIRAFDPGSIDGPYDLVANIPYYITGEILRSFLTSSHKPRSMTLLVQKEVAERITRAKKESLLSLSVKVFGTPTYCFTVPRGAFRPAPNVDSAVISIQGIKQNAFPSPEDEARFFSVLRAGFGHKRKQLANNLEEIAPRDAIENAFAAAGLAPKARSEDLSLEQWQVIARTLEDVKA